VSTNYFGHLERKKIKVNNMKKLNIGLLAVIVGILFSCSGSDTYRGYWKALDANGHKLEIVFEPKAFTIKDSLGQIKRFEYTQKSYEMSNSIETYGIALEDGRAYKIHFPKPDDTSIGLIKDDNDKPLYTIARQTYVTYDDIYKLN
ncbi:MAG: hypothetical protein L6Q46_13065, partial [Flavobacterium sp.]|uniref:hypothetical protein n=1 Tax=Flavobacterium sp. TaxID=239 RepID=UPI0025C65D68